MTKLRMGLSLVVLGGWLVGAGCDDDRGVVDLGAGGDDTPHQGGSGAGETALPGGAGSGAAAGLGGSAHAGPGGAPECPVDYFDADGTPCAVDGQECVDGRLDDPCSFGESLVCVEGSWERQEAFPSDCGASGGPTNGGAGAGGAGGQLNGGGAGGQVNGGGAGGQDDPGS